MGAFNTVTQSYIVNPEGTALALDGMNNATANNTVSLKHHDQRRRGRLRPLYEGRLFEYFTQCLISIPLEQPLLWP